MKERWKLYKSNSLWDLAKAFWNILKIILTLLEIVLINSLKLNGQSKNKDNHVIIFKIFQCERSMVPGIKKVW